MALSEEDEWLARQLGLVRTPGCSDEAFLRRLHGLESHVELLRQARRWGVPLRHGMSSQQVNQALHQHLVSLLEQGGMVEGAKVRIFDRLVEIKQIGLSAGRQPYTRIKYWILEPWDNSNNRGRHNHAPATDFLNKGELADALTSE